MGLRTLRSWQRRCWQQARLVHRFLDGSLRLVPRGWELELFEGTWTLAVLVPLAAIGVFLLTVVAYPLLEEWVAKDTPEHHILDRPRNAVTRTRIGVAGMTSYGVLWLAASADELALLFSLAFEHVILTLQATVIVGPVLAFVLTRRICIALQRKDRDLVEHGFREWQDRQARRRRVRRGAPTGRRADAVDAHRSHPPSSDRRRPGRLRRTVVPRPTARRARDVVLRRSCRDEPWSPSRRDLDERR